MRNKLSIIISAFNEEENINELYIQLSRVLNSLRMKSIEIIFVDDGSKDKTLLKCMELQRKDPRVKIVHFSKNFGHEIAMTAGMDYAEGDAVVFMDADLQHPPAYIKQMVELWKNGNDIILTRRVDNESTSKIYKFISKTFYKILNYFSDVQILENAPDFRLLDRKYVDFLKSFNERDFLFRGVLNLITSTEKTVFIDFIAPKRFAGKTKYTFSKSAKLAANSILQFSVKPLYFALWLAIISACLAGGIGIHAIIEYFFLNNPTPGFATTIAITVFMGSMNLFILAIIGAYIAKIHLETKKRPLYFAEYITSGKKLKGGKTKNYSKR